MTDDVPMVSFEVMPDPHLIPTVRLMLRRALPNLGSDDDSLYFGAFTEILANAMQAQAATPDQPVRVDLSLDARPSVSVADNGPGLDPQASLNPNRAGGRGNGLLIARSACPDMLIDSSASGTTVRLPFGPGPRR